MLNTLYHHFRHNYPVTYFLAVTLLAILLSGWLLSFTANNTALFDTLGLRSTITRIHAGKEAAFWTYRAWRHKDDAQELDPEHLYGYVESVNRDTTINISIVKDKQYQSHRIILADLNITNPQRLAAIVEAHKHANMEFAFYPTSSIHPYTVVWLNGEPFNLKLIDEGIATPDKTPPTNIVDRLFALYYWKQFTR